MSKTAREKARKETIKMVLSKSVIKLTSPMDDPLKSVIDELRKEYLCSDEDGKNYSCPCEDCETCLAKPFIIAIRVLTAAGKIVDRKAEILRAYRFIGGGDGNVNFYTNMTRDLVESLPDPATDRVKDEKEKA